MIPTALFIDRMDVARPAVSSVNQYGVAKFTTPAAHISNEPCRLEYIQNELVVSDNVTAEAGSPRLFCSPYLDIDLGDTVTVSSQQSETIKFKVISVRTLRGFGASHYEILGTFRP